MARTKPVNTRTSVKVLTGAEMASQAVTELPRSNRGAHKTTRYQDALIEARKVKGDRFIPIAHFTSVSGASTVKRGLLTGELLNDGVGDWEFRSVRHERGSTLYARLIE